MPYRYICPLRDEMKKRLIGLDIAKSVAIFCVIIIHYSFYSQLYSNNLIGNAVTVFTVIGVPIFFMVNGYLLMNSSFSMNKHIRKTIKMFVVLEVWKVLTLPCCAVIQEFDIEKKKVPSYLLGGTYDSIGYFWFMNALLAIYLIFPVLKNAFDDNLGQRYLLYAACGLMVFVFGVNALADAFSVAVKAIGVNISNPFGSLQEYNIFGNYSNALVYFLIGGYLPKIVDKLKSRLKNRLPLVLTVVSSVSYVLILLLQRYQARVDGVAFYVASGYNNVLVLLMAVSILSLLSGIEVHSERLKNMWGNSGSNTLGIYYLHYILIILTSRIIRHWYTGFLPLIINILLICCIYIVGLTISNIMKKIPIVRYIF